MTKKILIIKLRKAYLNGEFSLDPESKDKEIEKNINVLELREKIFFIYPLSIANKINVIFDKKNTGS